MLMAEEEEGEGRRGRQGVAGRQATVCSLQATCSCLVDGVGHFSLSLTLLLLYRFMLCMPLSSLRPQPVTGCGHVAYPLISLCPMCAFSSFPCSRALLQHALRATRYQPLWEPNKRLSHLLRTSPNKNPIPGMAG